LCCAAGGASSSGVAVPFSRAKGLCLDLYQPAYIFPWKEELIVEFNPKLQRTIFEEEDLKKISLKSSFG